VPRFEVVDATDDLEVAVAHRSGEHYGKLDPEFPHPDLKNPQQVRLDGANACPPEGIGGVPGYAN